MQIVNLKFVTLDWRELHLMIYLLLYFGRIVATRWYRAPEICGSFFSKMAISLEWGNFKSQQSQQKGTWQGRLLLRPALQYWVSNFRATFTEDKGRNHEVYSLYI